MTLHTVSKIVSHQVVSGDFHCRFEYVLVVFILRPNVSAFEVHCNLDTSVCELHDLVYLGLSEKVRAWRMLT